MCCTVQHMQHMHNVKTVAGNQSKSYRLRNPEKINADPFNTDRQSALHYAQMAVFS